MNLRGYALVTSAYWALTITDGAMRMLVLLHFHALGYGPATLGFLFVAYEACGIATNLLGGRLGQRYGLDRTLHLGLWLQVVALFALSMTEPTWAEAVSIAWVMGCQGLSGIAKDLTKMSSKSAVKLIVKEEQDGSHRSTLLRLVALLTGSKNALKGAGFFVGGALLAWIGFGPALLALAGMLAAASVATLLGLRTALPPAKTGSRTAPSWSRSPAVNRLSVARVFLFGARDLWFVVGLPIFLAEEAGWSVEGIGSFMAIWVIGYGLVQASAPWFQSKFVFGDRNSDESALARRWMLLLVFITLGIASVLLFGGAEAAVPAVVIGLLVFGLAFAVESALHSYLILAFASAADVAHDVGFYYAANATGRLFGTLLSGICFLLGGLTACLLVSAGFLIISALAAWKLPPARAAGTIEPPPED
ncbi:MAG: organoarsenical effux MFS transporter ArsJ [Phycisphaerales bacterium]|nr:organoarsenical effux MFS transporter ArsJ [Phycisphaerales bacterium]